MTAVNGIRGLVHAAIERASKATGVDFGFLMKTANRESGFNPTAKAGTSSAAGLFQFVEQTWLSTLKTHGGKYGYGQYAALIGKTDEGRYFVQGDARRAVMDLRFDAQAASLMAGELASDHAAYLRGRTGREPTSGELYAAHFLGPKGSAKLIDAMESRPGMSATALFPEAASANRSIFYRDGRPATVAEVYANLTKTGGDLPAVKAAPPEPFLQYASLKGLSAQQEQEALIAFILGGKDGDSSQGSGRQWSGSMFTSEMLKMLSDSRKT
jgi:hypothetical protein